MKRMRRIAAAALSLLLLLATLAACGGSSADTSAVGSTDFNGGMKNEMGFVSDEEMEAPDVADDAFDGGAVIDSGIGYLDTDAKVIRTAYMELETREYDSAALAITSLVKDLGGYLESCNTSDYGSYRYASYTVRVPAEKFEEFCDQAGKVCHVRDFNASTQVVSEAYYDIEARLTTQRTKLERLQALLAKAELMEDIITLESAISETELQIEYLSGDLRRYDSLVDMSTVDISLYEVYKLSNESEVPTSFGSRVASALRRGFTNAVDALEDFVVFLAYNALTVVILAAAVVVLVSVGRKKLRRRKAAKESKAAEESEKKE